MTPRLRALCTVLSPLLAACAPASPGENLRPARDTTLGAAAPEPPFPAEPTAESACDGGPVVLAPGVRLRELALYQVVKVPLLRDGVWIQQGAGSLDELPVVRGKRTLVRAFVERLPGPAEQTVRAVLTVHSGTQQKRHVVTRTVLADSREETLESTFNFELEGAEIRSDTALSLQLEQPSCAGPSGSPSQARFPEQGAQALHTLAVNPLKVVIVPVRINGRAPNVNERDLTTLHDALLAHYPVAQVELSTHVPFHYDGELGRLDLADWTKLISVLEALRKQDQADDDTYYFGLAQPAALFYDYCSQTGGCFLGRAPHTKTQSPSRQVGIGLSFTEQLGDTLKTVVHELGHTHGLAHAPCAPSGSLDGVDLLYPYARGATGVWGWDSRTNQLMPPTQADIMSYCDPKWVSDYTYRKLAARSLRVNKDAP